MPFVTDDPNMRDDWLVVGPATTEARTTRLLGETVRLWIDADGTPQCRLPHLGDQPLAVQSRYGYLWVCPNGQPARPLFDFPEYSEPGRRTIDCGGIGVAVSGLRVIENFLDMAHFPFVHADYLGKVPHTEVAQYQVQVEPATGEIWATDCRFWQPRASPRTIRAARCSTSTA
jgi:phenylpropionate dioxygenase-like ring-hydroxylating dioxygenase large terminal subunit